MRLAINLIAAAIMDEPAKRRPKLMLADCRAATNNEGN
jgi:hypothetical protein